MVVPLVQWTFPPLEELPMASEYILAVQERSAPIASSSSPALSSQAVASRIKMRAWHYVAALEDEVAQFETVFWEPNDTDSLRAYLANSGGMRGARVLEVGTGTGLIALCCARSGASQVVATDINPLALANAGYNAEHLELSPSIDFRLVSPEDPAPFSVVQADEQFDYIISNPPWENSSVQEVAAYALYDPGFGLLDALLSHASHHLNSDGQLLLAYGAKQAIRKIVDTAPKHGWKVHIADERSVDELPEVFLPGMLLVLTRM